MGTGESPERSSGRSSGRGSAAWRVMAWTWALSIAATLAACGGGQAPASSEELVPKSTGVAWERVTLPVDHWTGDDGQHVVRNTSDWARVWPSIQWEDSAAPPLSHVDFKQHMLVGVTSSYGGCSGGIAITRAGLEPSPQGDEWVVHFQVHEEAEPSMLCTTDMKPVADFILLPQSALPVRFIELPLRH